MYVFSVLAAGITNENPFNLVLIKKTTTKSHMYGVIDGCKDIAVAGGSSSSDPRWTQVRRQDKHSLNAAGEVLSKGQGNADVSIVDPGRCECFSQRFRR